MRLRLNLQPKQALFLKVVDEGKYSRLGKGGSRGGGKSKTLRDIQLFRRFKYPKTHGWIFRRTHEELKDNHIDPLFRDYPELREYWKSDDRALILPNESTLGFKYAETEGDVLKFRGKQAMDVTVDESNLMRESEMRELGMCTRAPGYPDHQCKLMEGFNPGGIGHNRIKRLFIDKNFLPNEIPSMYYFLPTFAWDNVAWSEASLVEAGLSAVEYYEWTDQVRFDYFVNKTQYGRELNALPEPDRSQQLLGQFNNFEGQVFGMLCAEYHDLDNWVQTEEEWRRFLSRCARYTGCLDHATTGTRAYLMTCLDSWDNRYALNEVYLRNVLIKEMVDEVKRLKDGFPKVDVDYIDPSTESDTQENVDEISSIQQAYRLEGLPTAVPMRTKIGVGLDLINKKLRIDLSRRHPFTGELGSPQIFFSRSRCPNLWREMTELQCIVRDGKIKYVGADHLTDDLRYIEMARAKPPKEPVPEAVIEQMHSGPQVLAVRSHAQWAQKFDKRVKPGRTYF